MPTDALMTEDEDSLEDRDQDSALRPPLDCTWTYLMLDQLPVRHHAVLSLGKLPNHPGHLPVPHATSGSGSTPSRTASNSPSAGLRIWCSSGGGRWRTVGASILGMARPWPMRAHAWRAEC